MKLTKGTLIDWGQQAVLLITVTILFCTLVQTPPRTLTNWVLQRGSTFSVNELGTISLSASSITIRMIPI